MFNWSNELEMRCGVVRRSVANCSSDFHRYNFPLDDHELPANVPRAARNFSEATRLIIMKVRITRIKGGNHFVSPYWMRMLAC